ncbi:MAG TPA: hypothetical protein VJV79_18400 [Polyangiaceae bacterium]|nr:hypothetical protein [Polyangiaceae bacterium]
MTLQSSRHSRSLRLWSLGASGLLLLLAACRSPAPEPAPPPASYELASAPPGARGARAAGTDAAPPRPSEGVLGEPGIAEEDEEEEETEPDAGAESDAGRTPAGPGGVAL